MNDDIRFILERAIRAPSGDNTQTLRWIVRGNTLELAGDPSGDLAGKITGGRAFHIAVGAMVENAVIAASVRGYRVDVRYFPDRESPERVADLVLLKDDRVERDPLAEFLIERVTNRRSFKRRRLSDVQREALLSLSNKDGVVRLVEGRKDISTLAHVASIYDELIFSNKLLHDNVFGLINWTKREDARRRAGFYYPTLAPRLLWPMMRVLRYWPMMRAGVSFGLHKLIALEQRYTYRHAGAYGLVLASGDALEDWVRAGRLAERLWLTVTKLGLSFHPLTGTLFTSYGLQMPEWGMAFSKSQQKLVRSGRATIDRVFDIREGETPAFMFRIGDAEPPVARTSRRPLEELVTAADNPAPAS